MGLRAPALVARAALLIAAAAQLGCPPIRRDREQPPRPQLDHALVAALDAPYASERARAAFRLGQLGIAWDPPPVPLQVEADDKLTDRLARERDDGVRVELVAALGRVGRAAGRRALLAELDRPGPARARAGWALAHLYRRLRDHDLDPAPDVAALGRALIAPEGAVRAAVTDALAETKREAARPLLLRELDDAEPLARARAARGLIGLLHVEDVPALEHALADPDERVAAAAAQALTTMGEQGSALAIAALTHGQAQLARPAVLVAIAHQQALRRAELAPLFAAIERLVAKDPRLDCIAALGHDRAAARVERVLSCGGAAIDAGARRRLVATVLGSCDPALSLGAVGVLLEMPTEDAVLRELVIAALGRYDDPRARRRVIAALDDPDAVVRATAAEAAAERGWDEAGPALVRALALATAHGAPPADEVDPTLSLVASAGVLKPAGAAAPLRVLLDGTPAALALAAREALGRLGERAQIHPVVPRGTYDDLALPPAPVRVRLDTDRGAIVIELDVEHAPKNARNFLGLVRRGFYDGLTFHRIVPGFVAQGGDPRGDGTGGSGHAVACEPAPTAYVEGTVGMALSGPDTGSSQFFITLAPAPHLEGRYTAFARVISGMDVARALVTDDRIVRAREETSTLK